MSQTPADNPTPDTHQPVWNLPAAVAAWLVPGLGHLLAGHTQRGVILMVCIGGLWTVLSPMPSTVTAANPLRYASIAASDALDKVLWDINLTETGRRLDAGRG